MAAVDAAGAASVAAVPPKGELVPSVAAWRIEYKEGPLSREDLEQYWVHGFVVKKGLLTTAELEPVRASIAGLVDRIAQDLYAAGKIKDLCADMPFETRLIAIEKQFPHASVLLHKYGILPDAVANLWSGPTLLACAKQLIGEDIAGHPVWNLRTKTPGQEQAVVPWHQDTAYLDPVSVGVHQATAWVPLVPATRENGCMEVLRYGHRSGREVKHVCCVGGTWYVQIEGDEQLREIGIDPERDIALCECALGDVLFLNNLIPHRSLPNVSSIVRWSLDLRWQLPSAPNGFYGLKDSVLMAVAGDPEFKPDWKRWAGEDRQALQLQAALAEPHVADAIARAIALDAPTATGVLVEAKTDSDGGSDAKFDTVIAGPWMARWNIVHHNRHVDRYLADAAAGRAGATWHAMDAPAAGRAAVPINF